LLKFAGLDEARFLGKGESSGGFQLQAVQRDRVTLLNVKAGKVKELALNPEQLEGSASGSELDQLLHPLTIDRSTKGKP
jgi:hypothetical protein